MTDAPTIKIDAMTFEQVRAALREASGSPVRSEADVDLRVALWRRLDELVAAGEERNNIPEPW
jgi:hypothetical protein